MNQTVQYERMGNMGNETRQHKIQNSRGAEKIARKAQEILRARNILAALAVIMSIAGREAPANANDQATKESASSKSNSTDELHYARSLSRAFREVAKRVGPSVVAITTIDRAPFSSDFGHNNLRKSPSNPHMPQRMRPGSEQRGEGTGIIYSSDGLIITNNHVIAGGDEIIVRLSDGREMPAKQVGSDPETGPPQIWWTLRIGEFDLARRSVSHGHDASIHTRVSSVCRQSCSC